MSELSTVKFENNLHLIATRCIGRLSGIVINVCINCMIHGGSMSTVQWKRDHLIAADQSESNVPGIQFKLIINNNYYSFINGRLFLHHTKCIKRIALSITQSFSLSLQSLCFSGSSFLCISSIRSFGEMHRKSVAASAFVLFWFSFALANVLAAPSLNLPREKRQSPMDMLMTGVAVGLDLMQQGVAGGHAGKTAISMIQRLFNHFSYYYSCPWICSPTDTPLFGFSHSHDVKAGTGDALDTISGRKKRELSSDTLTPWKSGLQLVTSDFGASTNPIDRQKRQTNEFPSQVDPMGEFSSNANGNSSNMSKIKNFFNKFVDAFDEMMVKVERIFRSAETDGTIATRADWDWWTKRILSTSKYSYACVWILKQMILINIGVYSNRFYFCCHRKNATIDSWMDRGGGDEHSAPEISWNRCQMSVVGLFKFRARH